VINRHDFAAASRDRRVLLDDRKLRVLSEDGQVARELIAPRGARCIDRDGDVFVVGCTDGSVHWLDAITGATLDVRQAHHAAVMQVQSCGDWVGVMGSDRRLVLTDAPGRWPAPRVRTRLAPAPLQVGPLFRACWSGGGRDVAVCAATLRVHDARDGRERAQWSEPDAMNIWCEHDVVLAYFRRRIDVYDALTLKRRGGGEVPPDNLERYAVLPTGTLLASTAGMIFVGNDGALRPIDTGARRRGGVLHHYGCHGEVSPDSTRCAIAPTDRQGILLSLPDGAWLAELAPKNAVWRFSPDGSRVLDARGGTIHDGHTGALVGRCGTAAGAAAWSRDGLAIARSEPDGAWWCDPDGARQRVLEGAPASGSPVFSPEGAHLVVARGATLACFDGRSGDPRGRLEIATCHDLRLAFFAEDRLLAVPNVVEAEDPTAWLVDPATASVVAPLARVTGAALHRHCPLRWGEQIVLSPSAGPLQLFRLSDGASGGVLEFPNGESLRSLEVCRETGDLLVALSGGTLLVIRYEAAQSP
jgi:hypothetical protein